MQKRRLRRFWAGLAAAGLLLGAASASALTTITFDDVVVNGFTEPILPNRYQAQGVLLSTDGSEGLYVFGPAAYNEDGGKAAYGSDTLIGGNPDTPFSDASFEIQFVNPVNAAKAHVTSVSIRVTDGQTNADPMQQWSVSTFDIDGNLIETVFQTTNDEVTLSFPGSGSTKISTVILIVSGEGESVDTITFDGLMVVPEPGVLLMLLTGSFGLWLRGRRRS